MTGSKPNSPLFNEYTERFEDTLEMIKNLNIMAMCYRKNSLFDFLRYIVVVVIESTCKSSLISNLIVSNVFLFKIKRTEHICIIGLRICDRHI